MIKRVLYSSKGTIGFVRTAAGFVLLVSLAITLNALITSRSSQTTINQSQQPVSQSISSVSTTAADDPNATTGWKTYVDATYSYTIKYPPTWSISRTSSDVQTRQRRVDFLSHPLKVGKEAPIMVSIVVYDNPTRLSALEWVERKAEMVLDYPRDMVSLRNVSVAGIRAIKVVGFPSQSGTMEVYLTKDFYTYVLILTPYDRSRNEIMLERIELFDLMLSTFAFT